MVKGHFFPLKFLKLTNLFRPNYMSYGAFGHVASHELTVCFVLSSTMYYTYNLDLFSMPSILLVAFTIKKESWNDGGQMPRVRVSR